MGYWLELGYPGEKFEVARVQPFNGGGTVPFDIESVRINQALGIEPYEYGDLHAEPGNLDIKSPVDDYGLVPASISVTINYSKRIDEVTNHHLSYLEGLVGAEGAALLMELIAGLGDETDYTNYWNPCDGNIKRLASTLLDWTFQHPDGTFRTLG